MTSPRHDNCFDVLRLLLALLVVYGHGRLLGGFGDDGLQGVFKGQAEIGPLAVLGFFGISGFLVTQSYIGSADPLRFLRKRALRILPAFYLALLFCAFVAAPLLAHRLGTSWTFPAAVGFIRSNALLKINVWTVDQETLGLPYAASLDGALWSLFPEALCYLAVLAIGLSGAFRTEGRRYELPALTAALFIVNLMQNLSGAKGAALLPLIPTFLALTNLTPYFLAFAVGAAVQTFQPRLALGRGGAALFGIATLLLLKFGGWAIFGPVCFPLFLLHFAHSFQLRLTADLSYGLYVFHFPCEQLLASWMPLRSTWALYFLLTLLASTTLAWVSWTMVESPALRRK